MAETWRAECNRLGNGSNSWVTSNPHFVTYNYNPGWMWAQCYTAQSTLTGGGSSRGGKWTDGLAGNISCPGSRLCGVYARDPRFSRLKKARSIASVEGDVPPSQQPVGAAGASPTR
jgi:hypothetical protein